MLDARLGVFRPRPPGRRWHERGSPPCSQRSRSPRFCPLIVAVGYAAAGVTLCAGAVLVGIALVALGALADRRAP
ncbi:MAG: hypothetical protein M5U08_13865 [Burkholderiales bacterium]|nr:hypothetical protein [Burkholderiales bacterium]